jgi:predicted NBD/HSP70 family sugar kinase
MTSGFDGLLDPGRLKEFGVGRGTVADVLARIVMAAPDGVPQVDIASGIALPGLAELPQGSVSRASGLLLSLGLLTKEERRVERPGRPIIPLRLGAEWILAGVKVRHHGGRPAEVAAVLAPLDGTHEKEDRKVSVKLGGKTDHETLVRTIAQVVHELTRHEHRKLLGVGVELGGHIYQGNVIVVPSPAEDAFPLAEQVSEALSGQPTVVENDVNARAVLEIWKKDRQSNKLRFPQQHFAVVAVFDEGVGASLVIDRRVYRGGHGMAGAIGHLTVDYRRPRRRASSRPDSSESELMTFNDPCLCAREFPGPDGAGYGHVDALATPTRIAGELGIRLSLFAAAAQERCTVKGNSRGRTGDAFWTAGEALGRGIAALLNITNPANVLVLLPPVLADPAEGTAGALYKRAIEATLDKDCFSTAAEDARAGRATLLVEALDPDDAFQGARAAAACVLDSFIAHARGEDTESLAAAGEPRTRRFFRVASRE